MARHYPDCGHVRPKGDRYRRCVTCLGRDHAEGALPGLSPSPPPVSPGAAVSEAEELQPSGVQPIPHDALELDISLDDDSLLDFSDEHSSIAEAMQTSHDIRLRVETPPT